MTTQERIDTLTAIRDDVLHNTEAVKFITDTDSWFNQLSGRTFADLAIVKSCVEACAKVLDAEIHSLKKELEAKDGSKV